jgi:hypothetical protein
MVLQNRNHWATRSDPGRKTACCKALIFSAKQQNKKKNKKGVALAGPCGMMALSAKHNTPPNNMKHTTEDIASIESINDAMIRLHFIDGTTLQMSRKTFESGRWQNGTSRSLIVNLL